MNSSNGPNAAPDRAEGSVGDAHSVSNSAYVAKALKYLSTGIAPFLREQLARAEADGRLGENWTREVRVVDKDATVLHAKDYENWDIPLIIKVIQLHWAEVFKKPMGYELRNILFEARNVRNDWAHQREFTAQDAYRAVDTIARILEAVRKSQHEEVEQLRMALLEKMNLEGLSIAEPDVNEVADRPGPVTWLQDSWSRFRRAVPVPIILASILLAGAGIVAWSVIFPAEPAESQCHPSYPDLCLDPEVADYNCTDIEERNFRVVDEDPYGLDSDGDGTGCES